MEILHKIEKIRHDVWKRGSLKILIRSERSPIVGHASLYVKLTLVMHRRSKATHDGTNFTCDGVEAQGVWGSGLIINHAVVSESNTTWVEKTNKIKNSYQLIINVKIYLNYDSHLRQVFIWNSWQLEQQCDKNAIEGSKLRRRYRHSAKSTKDNIFDSVLLAALCESMTSCTKTEVHTVLHCRQRRTEPR